MKVAIIGGNLLGCATAVNLAIVQEHDERKMSINDKFEITLFEKTNRLGGNGFRSITIVNEQPQNDQEQQQSLYVEVGTYRTLPLSSGTFLTDLVNVANDCVGTVDILGRKYRIPGSTTIRRGKHDAAKVIQPWQKGSYRSVIRSFAAWDWRDDSYHLLHRGWPLLDLLHRLFDNHIWRSLALAGLIWSIDIFRHRQGTMERAIALGQVVIMFGILLLSPKRIVAHWQRQYSFWGTTLPLLFKHGITPAISRGSTIGFIKHLTDMNTKNVATCSISVGNLIHRGGLDAYIRGTGEDYVRKFKYDQQFVNTHIAPIVSVQYDGVRLSDVSSLASHFAMLDGDYSNSDANIRFSQIAPNNETLCPALIDAARASIDVDVQLECPITNIVYDENESKYILTTGSGQSEIFDGVILCASPKEGDMTIETPVGATLSDLLGYDRDRKAAEGHATQEAEYIASQTTSTEEQNESEQDNECPIEKSACSHIAVVTGIANAAFFRFTTEEIIPDLVQITHAPGVSRFERIREVTDTRPGIYTVLCGSDFESSGLLAEMFLESSSLIYHELLPRSPYSHTALPIDKGVDECTPLIVLGTRFIYAAATEKLAKHPELDAMSAVNAASLFSRAVQWASSEDADDDRESNDIATQQL